MTERHRNWIAVACAGHVGLGQKLGIMQVSHGKAGPLRRNHAGDRVVYYSPTRTQGGRERCQAFTAIGNVRDEHVYQVDMGEGFCPFRRDVEWWKASEVSIHSLRQHLELTTNKKNWGYVIRYGLLNISEHDMGIIAGTMVLLSSLHRS